MKVIALLLLCSCSHVATEIPASLPFVLIDESLMGPVMSREASEIVATRRRLERAKWSKWAEDLKAQAKTAEMQRDEEKRRADAHTWWAIYGGPLALGLIVVGGALGATFTLLAEGKLK